MKKKESKWIGSIKCTKNLNFSYMKRRCSEFNRIFFTLLAFMHRLGVLVAVPSTSYGQMSKFLLLFSFLVFIFNACSFISCTVCCTHYFSSLFVMRLIPFVHYRAVVLSLMQSLHVNAVTRQDVYFLFHLKGTLNFVCHIECTLLESKCVWRIHSYENYLFWYGFITIQKLNAHSLHSFGVFQTNFYALPSIQTNNFLFYSCLLGSFRWTARNWMKNFELFFFSIFNIYISFCQICVTKHMSTSLFDSFV